MNCLADRELIGGLVAVLVASYAAFFGWVVASINRLDRKIDALDVKLTSRIDTKIDALEARLNTRIDALKAKLNTKIDALDAKFSTRIDALSNKVDALTVAVARLAGAVWSRAPLESAQGRV